MTKPIIMYHGGCPDGFGAAWTLDNYLRSCGAYADLYPCKYGTPPPDVTDRFVYMADFCYDNLDWMNKIITTSRGCVILDHHQTGIPFVTGDYQLDEDISVYDCIEIAIDFGNVPCLIKGDKSIIIDQNHSGAVLAGLYTGYLTQSEWTEDLIGSFGEFLYYIEDRDIWKWVLPNAHQVTSAIDLYNYSIDDYDVLSQLSSTELNTIGTPVYEYKMREVSIAASYAQPVTIADIKMLGAPSSYSLGSDVAHQLAKKSSSGIGVYWVDQPGFRKYGLRSLEDGPNVAEICNKFGGGGHIHAAGFAVKSETIIIEVPDGDV